MPEVKCFAVEDEPGPINWVCNRPPGHEPPHAATYLNQTHHTWEDQPCP